MFSNDNGCETRRLRGVNVRSVVVVAAVFNTMLGVAFFIAGWLVVTAAAHAGLLDNGQTAAGHAPGVSEGPSSDQLMTVWTAIVAGWIVVMTAVWGLAALALNWSARRFGGIEVEVENREIAPRDFDVQPPATWPLPVLVEQKVSGDLDFVTDMVDAVPAVHPADQ
jgi:hypothetical protein